MRRRALLCAAALAVAALLAPAAAAAHGLVGKQDLPIPKWLFAWGAAAVVAVSFAGLALLWPRPRLEKADERLVLKVPARLEIPAGLAGVLPFAALVYAGFSGVQTATANVVPTAIYVLFWVGLPVLSAVFGDVFRAINPWLAVGRAVGWVRSRLGSGSAPRAYPSGWVAGQRRLEFSRSRGSSSCIRTATTRASWRSWRSCTRAFSSRR